MSHSAIALPLVRREGEGSSVWESWRWSHRDDGEKLQQLLAEIGRFGFRELCRCRCRAGTVLFLGFRRLGRGGNPWNDCFPMNVIYVGPLAPSFNDYLDMQNIGLKTPIANRWGSGIFWSVDPGYPYGPWSLWEGLECTGYLSGSGIWPRDQEIEQVCNVNKCIRKLPDLDGSRGWLG